MANVAMAILKYHDIQPTIKWVDDFILFCVPNPTTLLSLPQYFSYDFSSILKITSPLDIPWNLISKKGHNFQSSFIYMGFC